MSSTTTTTTTTTKAVTKKKFSWFAFNGMNPSRLSYILCYFEEIL